MLVRFQPGAQKKAYRAPSAVDEEDRDVVDSSAGCESDLNHAGRADCEHHVSPRNDCDTVRWFADSQLHGTILPKMT